LLESLNDEFCQRIVLAWEKKGSTFSGVRKSIFVVYFCFIGAGWDESKCLSLQDFELNDWTVDLPIICFGQRFEFWCGCWQSLSFYDRVPAASSIWTLRRQRMMGAVPMAEATISQWRSANHTEALVVRDISDKRTFLVAAMRLDKKGIAAVAMLNIEDLAMKNEQASSCSQIR
jgi:hypothetical protein